MATIKKEDWLFLFGDCKSLEEIIFKSKIYSQIRGQKENKNLILRPTTFIPTKNGAMSIPEASKHFGVPITTIRNRIARGLNAHDVLFSKRKKNA